MMRTTIRLLSLILIISLLISAVSFESAGKPAPQTENEVSMLYSEEEGEEPPEAGQTERDSPPDDGPDKPSKPDSDEAADPGEKDKDEKYSPVKEKEAPPEESPAENEPPEEKEAGEPVDSVDSEEASETDEPQDGELSEADQPSENEEPIESEEPAEGDEPEKTGEPAETNEPSENNEPGRTEEPAGTDEPSETEKPIEPSETAEPDEPSGIPESSPEPEDTPAPSGTPADSPEPAETPAPAEDETITPSPTEEAPSPTPAVPPVVTAKNITVTGASGTGETFKIGDTVTVTWDNTADGNNNDDIESVTVDFSSFGGGSGVEATNDNGTWTAVYTVTNGSIDRDDSRVSITVTNTAEEQTTVEDDADYRVDNQAPQVTDAGISITGGSGAGGVFRLDDTVIIDWNYADEKSNADISSATFDFSGVGGGVEITDSDPDKDGTCTVQYKIQPAGWPNLYISVKVQDDAGNSSLYRIGNFWAPEAATGEVTEDETGRVTLAGELTDLGSAAEVKVFCEWGEDAGYGKTTESQVMKAPGPFKIEITEDLDPGKTYHYRVVAAGELETTCEDKTFEVPEKAVLKTRLEILDADMKPITGKDFGKLCYDTDFSGLFHIRNSGETTVSVYAEDDYQHSSSDFLVYIGRPSVGNVVALAPGESAEVLWDLYPAETGNNEAVKFNIKFLVKAGDSTETESIVLPCSVFLEMRESPVPGTPTHLAVITRDAAAGDDGATLYGELTGTGSQLPVKVYFEWGETEEYGNRTDAKNMDAAVNYTAELKNLKTSTTYHFRAVAEGEKTVKGKDKQFTTSGAPVKLPEIATREATDVKQVTASQFTATLNGELISRGSFSDVQVFFEWGESTKYGNTTQRTWMNNNNVPFSANIKGLKADVIYHFRAVVIGPNQTRVEGKDMSFTPVIKKLGVTTGTPDIGITQADLFGYLTGLGSKTPVKVYFEWGETEAYGNTTAVQEISETGRFNTVLRNLKTHTTYHYRAVAVGDKTVKGEDVTFTPCAVITLDVSDCTETEVTLHGRLHDLNFAEEPPVCFEWGTDTSYGNITEPFVPYPGYFQTHIKGLTPGTTYHYRARVDIVGEIHYGLDKQFTTSPASPSPKLSLKIISVTTPVTQGSNATLRAETVPGAKSEITVHHKSGVSKAKGLEPKTADSEGKVSWTWKVGTNTTPGVCKIDVTASLKGETVSESTEFEVLDKAGSVVTLAAKDISSTSATLQAELTDMGNASEVIIAFEWCKSSKKYTYQTPPQIMKEKGKFSYKLTGLSPGTRYYYRVKVWDTRNKTTAYGTEKTFRTHYPAPPRPPPKEKEGDHIIINTDNFISNTRIEVNINNTITNNIQLKTRDEVVILDIPEKTRLQDTEGKVPESFTLNVLILPVENPAEGAIIQAYEFGPEGAVFDPPVTLTLKYDLQMLPQGAQENDLTIAGWNGTRWAAIESQVDTLTKTVSAKISKFGKYALLAPVVVAQTAKMTCSGLTITPAIVQPDEAVHITTTVSNAGNIAGTIRVILKVDDSELESRDLSLEASKSETVTFEYQLNDPGEHVVDVNGNSGKFIVTTRPATEITPSAAEQPTAAAAETISPEASQTDSSPASANGEKNLPVLWIIIASLVVIGAVIGVTIGRRKPQE